MRRNARRYITRIAQSISSQYLRGFFIVVCSLCNSLLVYFPDAAQQHLREMRRAILHLTQSINMGNEYIRAQFARFGTQHIACCILNEACCTKIQNSDSAGYRSISSQYLRGFLLLFVRFVTRCWFISR